MSGIAPDILTRIYRDMVRIRVSEERIAAKYPEQEMRCPVHLCIGQEAIAAGVCAALKPSDYVLSGHRAHGHYIAKGGNLNAMMAEIYGRIDGCCGGKGGSMHLIDTAAGFLGSVPIVGSTLPIAVGAALNTVMRGEDRVTVVFFGDGATEEGVFHESLNFASLKKLPVIFVCENNGFSVYSDLSVRQPPREIWRLAGSHGIEAIEDDGNCAELVYLNTVAAVERARQGKGPSFLEFKTYRLREHCGPNFDDHLGYRDAAAWKTRDPILQLAATLDPSSVLEIQREAEQEIDLAIAFAKQSPYPEYRHLWEHLVS